jgi:glutathione S-transferase
MALKLYYHPLSSYCQKALVALYENDIPFERRQLDGPDSPAARELSALWPMERFPVLVDGDRTVIEATCIVEYLGLYRPGPVRLIPEDPKAALETRFMDRFFDNYVATPQQKVVFDALRPQQSRDPYGVRQAREMLETSYAWLDKVMATREWAAGDRFSLADCLAASFAGLRLPRSADRCFASRFNCLARFCFCRRMPRSLSALMGSSSGDGAPVVPPAIDARSLSASRAPPRCAQSPPAHRPGRASGARSPRRAPDRRRRSGRRRRP